MKIIDLIKKCLTEKGIDAKHADRILKTFKVEKEEDIASAVDSFTENILPAIEEAKTKSQKDAEEAAKKAAIEAYEKEHGLQGGKSIVTPATPNLEGLDPNVKALIEAQSGQIAELTKAFTTMLTNQSRSQKLDIVRAKMKGKVDDDFLEDFAGRVNLESDSLDAEIDIQVGNYTKMNQKFINKAVKDGTYEPVSGGVSDGDFDGFLKTKSDNAPAFEGAKI